MFFKKGASKAKASQKSKKGNFAGLALHGDGARYVELSGGRGALRLEERETVPLPRGTVVKDSLVFADALAAAFESLKQSIGGFNCPVVIGIPSRDVILRLAEYPKMPAEDVKEILQFEFGKYFPYPYDEAALDVAEVEVFGADAGDDKAAFLVAACRQRTAAGIMKAASRAGMNLAAAEPMNAAFFRAVTGPEPRDGGYLVVSAEAESTQIMFGYKDNGVLFRSCDGTAQILKDVRDTAVFASNRYKGAVPHLIILGGADKNSEPCARLGAEMSMTVESPDVWYLWGIRQTGGGGFETALGLALRNLI